MPEITESVLRPVYIYALCEPGTFTVRYIGKTVDIPARIKTHLAPSTLARRSHRSAWIKSVLARGGEPEVRILDIADESCWESMEQWYISQYLQAGFDLVNSSIGGRGGATGFKHSEEAKQRRSEAQRGRRHTPEAIEKIKQARAKQVITAEHIEKVAVATRGKKKSPEHVAKVAAAKRGFRHRPESIERMREAARRRYANESTGTSVDYA